MKIVITDCDHATIDAEQKAADAAGHELQLTQSATEEEVIANAAGADALVVQYAPITAAVLDALPSVRAVGRYGVGGTLWTSKRRPSEAWPCATCPTTAPRQSPTMRSR